MPKKAAPEISAEAVEVKDTLSGIIKESMPIFQGHPAAGEPEKEEEGKDTLPPKEKPPKKGKEVKEPPKKEEEIEGGEPPEKPEGEEEDPVTLQYESQEEAEKAVKEAKNKMHKATTEAKKLQEKMDRLQEQVNALMVDRVSKGNEKPLTKADEKKVLNYVEDYFDSMSKLDSEDKEFNKKAASVLAGLLETVMGKERESYKELINQSRAEDKEKTAEERRRDESVKIAGEMAEEAGLDMRQKVAKDEDGAWENSPDYDLFWRFARSAPGETLKDQVEWAIKEVNRFKTLMPKPKEKEDPDPKVDPKKAREHQEKNAPLTRHNAGRVVTSDDTAPPKPMSLTEALRETHGKHRI